MNPRGARGTSSLEVKSFFPLQQVSHRSPGEGRDLAEVTQLIRGKWEQGKPSRAQQSPARGDRSLPCRLREDSPLPLCPLGLTCSLAAARMGRAREEPQPSRSLGREAPCKQPLPRPSSPFCVHGWKALPSSQGSFVRTSVSSLPDGVSLSEMNPAALSLPLGLI